MSAQEVFLLLAIGLPLAGSPLLAVAGRRLGRRVIEWPWIPSLGLALSFVVRLLP